MRRSKFRLLVFLMLSLVLIVFVMYEGGRVNDDDKSAMNRHRRLVNLVHGDILDNSVDFQRLGEPVDIDLKSGSNGHQYDSPNESSSVPRKKDVKTTTSSLTIFSILKEFQVVSNQTDPWMNLNNQQGVALVSSVNAVRSWLHISPNVTVMLFGDKATCSMFMGHVVPYSRGVCLPIPCFHATYFVPTYDCIYDHVRQTVETDFAMYSNSDIMYFPDLLLAIEKIAERFDNFLAVGNRWDFDHNGELVEFDKIDSFKEKVRLEGSLHGRYGIDYFAFRSQYVPHLPAFLVGRINWDNWLLSRAIHDPMKATVEISSVALALHLNHGVVGISHERFGTEVNDRLAGDRSLLVLGSLDQTDYVLVPNNSSLSFGQCPDCYVRSGLQSLDVMLYKQAATSSGNAERTVFIASVNFGYIDFAYNWYCSLMRSGVTNYLFHAMDSSIYDQLRQLELPAILYESSIASKLLMGKNHTNFDYGSLEYQALMNSRTELINRVLSKRYNAVLCDVDIVILKNPMPYLNFSLDIHGQEHKGSKVSGGFLFLHSTPTTQRVWTKVLHQHRNMLKRIEMTSDFDVHSNTEQELLNRILLKSKSEEILWSTIGPTVIADGKRFFIDKLTQANGEWPVAIHNNYIIGKKAKIKRFQDVDLWYTQADQYGTLHCKALPSNPKPPQGEFKFVIIILAFDRPTSLKRLLRSLEDVDFENDNVRIDIFVDRPVIEDGDDADHMENWRNVIAVAKEFTWPHGEKNLNVLAEHHGLADQWLNCWNPQSDSEVAIILEDDNVVSPYIYRWIKRAVQEYYFNPENFDPNMYGIATQYQHVVAGHYPTKPQVEDGYHLFRYQLGSTWGPVFFPNHWRTFVSWYNERSAEPSFQPFFSNLITNHWYLRRGGGENVWSAWFIRFVAERGWYGLYTNFPSRTAFCVNYRDAGMNVKNNKGPDSSKVMTYDPYMSNFPSLSNLPLYDFHFNKINDPRVLYGRAFYATSPSNILSNQ